MRVAIFASGNGSNFEVLAQAFQAKKIAGNLVLLFCDHPDAYVIERAKKYKIKTVSFTVKECGGKGLYEKKIAQLLEQENIDFIALAGYMRVIGPLILSKYEGKIVNIHPAYLPEYPGLHSIERALADGKQKTGVTIHYIDSGVDSGPIIAQEHVAILADDTLETLEQRVHACEHRMYPRVLAQILEKR
ncbi:phosphoribosylglycinamide formyltransferase [Ligilactobacillus sp. Marseille-Q7487]|uniref:phosphoribosylglycinamide formyltransferase n=1 Tax=Ligilactobacillus sp. Marseille-Q7487 TaxID=3022128 RepID=UPI0015B49127|nr:phosphoribosylglycinamide formyltransferase [Ligilactobacillus sp. Marseille-Q7487]